MKKKFTFLIAAIAALMLITLPGKAVGETISFIFTGENSNCNETSGTVSGINYESGKTGSANACSYNTTNGLVLYGVASGGGYFQTTTAISGSITNISVTTNNKKNSPKYTVYGSTNGSDWTQIGSQTDGGSTENFDTSEGYTYVKIANTTAATAQLGVNSVIITYTPASPAYTITAQSNNTDYGTVSLSGSVITGSPNTGYRYATPAYTVAPANSATVSQDGNTFTVTPSANTTVTINFEAIPTYTVTLGDDNSTLTEASAGAGVTLPTRSALNGYAFAGWSDTNVTPETTTAPTIIAAGIYYPTENITLYPVYTKSGGGTTPSAFSVGDTGDYAIVSAAQNSKYYALPTNPTVSSGKITGQEITVNELNNVKYVTPSNASGFTWTIASATNGYTLSDGTNYIYHSNGGSSGTNLAYGNSTSYTWNFTADGDYVTMAGMSGSTTNNRGMLFQGTTIGGYALSNASSSDYYKIMILPISAGSTTYYWSSPVAPTVEKPTITIAENPFLFSTTVTITCATDDATIKYSYDGETWSDYPNAGLTITETKTIYAKGVKGTDESQVAQATATKTLAQPTVTISGNLIVDLDGETSVAAGTLTAAVTYNSAAIEGATVTWESNHTDIATINASTGAVTLLTTGTVTFTATYAQNSDYAGATDTKTITVIDSKGPGSFYDPYTVAEALSVINTLEYNGTLNNKYVKGIISAVNSYNSSDNSITYKISDDGTTSSQLHIYHGLGLDGAIFSAKTDLTNGDEVVVFGNLKRYKTGSGNNITITPEFDSNSKIKSYIHSIGDNSSLIAGTVVDFTIENNESYTVAANTTLKVTGELVNNNPDNLIIEDGGQLICSNPVAATVKKNITNASAKAGEKWYAISSSVHDNGETFETIDNVTNLTSGTYDMFCYDEPSNTWFNQKPSTTPFAAGFSTMMRGRGYIYRNAADKELAFTGETNVGTVEYGDEYNYLGWSSKEESLKGFNLVGNPYPHKIYKGVAFATTSGTTTDTLVTGYYALEGDGSWTAKTNSDAIDVNQAILVEATEYANGKKLQFKDRTTAPNAKSNNDNIMFTVENSAYSDIAYAWFDNGNGLKKIEHRNANIPMLYINQDGTDYAIAMMSDNTKSFGLNFKAKTMGTYTLSYKAEGNFDYLHVIDRLTGEDVDMLMDGKYSFVGSPQDNAGRFIVKLGYDNGSSTDSETFVYQNGNDIIVDGEGTLEVFDVTGRKVMTTDINGVETINGLNTGVYIFRVIGETLRTQKIVVR